MKNLNNILDEITSQYKNNSIQYEIVENRDNYSLVNVYNKDAPGSLLQFEIVNDVCCVLQKVNVGRKSMVKFMNRFVEAM